jgi:dTDP-4-amino-4,6-dideoxygalactose transaminase
VIGGEQIEPVLTERTRAVLPVHLFGQCADMDSIAATTRPREIAVIEDAAQAHGARYKGRCAGTLGDAAAFSFFPSKNLGCWGESGAITTNSAQFFEKTKLVRDHGSTRKYEHAVVGGNFRSNEFQGIVLGVKLRYLQQWNQERKHMAALYSELLAGSGRVQTPLEAPHNDSAWHLYVIRVDNRQAFREHLEAHGIQTAIHYPIPLHLSGAYKSLGHLEGDFPIAERLQSEVVSLPLYPGLAEDDVRFIADVINGENW